MAGTTKTKTAERTARGAEANVAETVLTHEQRQAIARAVADPRRFEILEQIAGTPGLLCGQLNVQESLSPATISHHLKELQEAGLVEAERQGRSMCLKLRRDVWQAYVRSLEQL